MGDHDIELVAMQHEIFPAIRRDMDRAVDEFDVAEIHAEIITQEFIVIAGQIDEARALAHLAQQLLHNVVLHLRPIPAAFETPAVNNVADKINDLGLIATQELDQKIGLAAGCPKMNIGDEECSDVLLVIIAHDILHFDWKCLSFLKVF